MKKYSLTASQKLLLYFQLLNRKRSDGNVCGSFLLKNKVDFDKLKKAVNLVVEKNDSLRTRINFYGMSFKQYFKKYEPFDIEIIDVKTDDDVIMIENKMNHEVFSMLNKQLFKIKFVRFEDGTGGIVCCMHHIICDAWTVGLAIKEIMAYYSEDEVNYEAFQYYEHIKDEKDYLHSNTIKKDKEFWKDYFKDNIPKPARIKGDINKEFISRKANYYKVQIPKEVMTKINEYCKQIRISNCSFITGVFALYMGMELKIKELLLDTIISNRATYKDKHTTGLFAKTLPFKASIKDKNFEDYIININRDLGHVYKHYKYPTKDLLRIVKSKDVSINRTSKIWFSFQNAKTDKDSFKVPFVTRWTPIESTYLYDMLIELYDLENNGSLDIIYNFLVYKYSNKRMIEIHNAIYSIIQQVLENPKINLKDLQIKKSKFKIK